MASLPPRQARLRFRALLAPIVLCSALLLGAACTDSGDRPTPTTGPGSVPTAPPLASVPSPTIVTGSATPTGTGTPTTGTGAAGANAGEQSYTVVAGDVLTSIAVKFDVPSAQIRTLNNLTTDTLQIGQKLRIPAKTAASGTPPPSTSPGSASTYTVKAGDTAFGIALQFDTTTEALERANSVQRGGLDNLQLGQVVKLPPPGQR